MNIVPSLRKRILVVNQMGDAVGKRAVKKFTGTNTLNDRDGIVQSSAILS